MKVEQFIEEYNYAPYSIEEVAEVLLKVEDNDIALVAKDYLEVLNELYGALDDIGFEFG